MDGSKPPSKRQKMNETSQQVIADLLSSMVDTISATTEESNKEMKKKTLQDPKKHQTTNNYDFSIIRIKLEKSYKQIATSRQMRKFYARRYQLFTRFDAGILLDHESWFSVTPEAVARHVATKCFDALTSRNKNPNQPNFTVLDGFCGSGGNTIQFAQKFAHVIAVDIDFVKLQCAQHNATLYEPVSHKITFLVQDFFSLHKTLNTTTNCIDLVFLSPPWGGVDYFHRREKDLSRLPLDTFKVYSYCLNVLKCRNVAFFLPRNANLEQIVYMAGPGGRVCVEQNFLDHKLVAISAYYGDLCSSS